MSKKLSLLAKLTKRTLIGGGIGFTAARVVSTSHEADVNSLVGTKIGVIGGFLSAATIPFIRNKTVREAAKAAGRAASDVVFRRIRGRIIPIRRRK